MSKYLVDVEWSGYSRGVSTYSVEADTAEEAEENYSWHGDLINREVVRSDIERGDVLNVTLGTGKKGE